MEENLVFSARCYGIPKAEAIARKDQILEELSLAKYAKYVVGKLSGGYRQRFLIARALMHNPKIIFLDEPTVGLDPHVRREMWDMIAQLRNHKITVLLTTHYLDEAEYLSDRICLLHDGVIRVTDTPDGLKKKHGKNNLEEVFLEFVDDPNAEIFNGEG